MKSEMDTYVMPFVYLFAEMAPYLLMGFFIAGLLHAFVPQNLYHKWLSGNDAKSVLGLPFAILRPVAALITGFFGGIAVNTSARKESDCSGECTVPAAENERSTAPRLTFLQRCRSAISYGFSEMIQDIGRWLVIGLVLAGLINIFVPEGFFTALSDTPLLNMLVVLLIAVPMYVCATGSIPIAAALMLKGLSPGAALVFLMADPAEIMAAVKACGYDIIQK